MCKRYLPVLRILFNVWSHVARCKIRGSFTGDNAIVSPAITGQTIEYMENRSGFVLDRFFIAMTSGRMN